MKAVLGIYYQAECGRTEADPRLVAVLDVEHWLEMQHLPVGARKAATDICAALDEYPALVEQIMQRYQAAIASASEQALVLCAQSPGLSD